MSAARAAATSHVHAKPKSRFCPPSVHPQSAVPTPPRSILFRRALELPRGGLCSLSPTPSAASDLSDPTYMDSSTPATAPTTVITPPVAVGKRPGLGGSPLSLRMAARCSPGMTRPSLQVWLVAWCLVCACAQQALGQTQVLVVGGQFTTAGGVVANRIAQWDGYAWSSLSSGMNDFVSGKGLVTFNNSLIAGGPFTSAGGVAVNRVARWNDTNKSWSALGSGLDTSVTAFALFNGTLVAGGMFTTAGSTAVNHVSKWDGVIWSSLGTGTNDFVNDLVLFNNQLVAGGGFTTAGGIAANRIAAWDSLVWSSLGSGMNDAIGTLLVFNNTLVAGGLFTMAGGIPANGIARWNGTAWSAFSSGMNGNVIALTAFQFQLIAGGWFTTAGGTAASGVARWDANSMTWSALSGGMNDWVNALTVFNNKLIATGWFTLAGGVSANRIAQWDGATWTALGSGMDREVYAVAVLCNCSTGWSGTLCDQCTTGFGAQCDMLCSVCDVHGACLPGLTGSCKCNAGWTGELCTTASTLALTATVLVAGGSFTTAGGVSANGVAQWNGTAWSTLDVHGMNGEVRALSVFNDQLVAGGYFTLAGGVPANRIALWNGTAWSALGLGIQEGNQGDPVADYYVCALAVYEDNLVASGIFSTASGVAANNIAQWNGAAWSALDVGMEGYVGDLAVFHNSLYAGGEFRTAGGLTVNFVARWEG